MRLFNERSGDHRAVLQHIIQIDQITVVHMLGVVIRIMEVDNTCLVSLHHLRGKQNAAGNILGHLASHVVPLHRVDGGILVGVLLLDLFIVALNQTQNPVVGGVGLAHQAAGIAVGNILLGHLERAMRHDGLLHQILNFLDGGAVTHLLAGNPDTFGNPLDLQRCHANLFVNRIVGLGDGHLYLRDVKNDFRAVSLDDFHWVALLFSIGGQFFCTTYYTTYCGFVKWRTQNMESIFISAKKLPNSIL